MASSDFWQKLSAMRAVAPAWEGGAGVAAPRRGRGASRLWMAADGLTILGAVVAATLLELRTGLVAGARYFWHGRLIHGRSMGLLLALLCGFAAVLILTSRRLNLYAPLRLTGHLREQTLTLQACFTSGLLLTGTLYLLHANDIPRGLVLLTIALVTVGLSLRRFFYRILLYHRYDRGVDTRNVLIVGAGREAEALRQHLENMRHLGYRFKGFVELAGGGSGLEGLFQQARRHFVDEIFFTAGSERGVVQKALEEARRQGVDLRLVPDMWDGLAWNSAIEYIGEFATIPLHCGRVPELGLVCKRVFDLVFSALVLVVLSPLLGVIAAAIKLDSPGPVFYSSERIGKKGRMFRCTKFRTMVADAERRRAEIMHMNERDGVLFKVTKDPRVTRLGQVLRKYSLDELPQFWNVLKGEMSVVGPRPPLASEVKEYKLSHLRRLDVTPGITGLWQVQGRQDPSFASYVSLDVTYIDNWSVWLDFKIILRTIAVVLAGTGA